MNKDNVKRLINLLRTNREKTLQLMLKILIESDKKITVPQELLTEIFIRKENNPDNEKKEISVFRTDKLTLSLYNYFDFSNFNYKNLKFDTMGEFSTLNIMKKNDITLYPEKIYNKEATFCKFRDIKIEGSFDDWNIEGTNFNGYIGKAIINPEKLKNKNLKSTRLAGVHITGGCKNINIKGTKFKDAIIDKEFYINPREIYEKSLEGTDLSGVTIKGSFDNAIIFRTSFKGSNVLIPLNLDKIRVYQKGYLEENDFEGVTLEGDLSKYKLSSNNFTGSKGGVIDFKTNSHVDSSNNNFTGVKFRNIRYANMDFLFNHSYFNFIENSIIVYDASNAIEELKWFDRIIKAGYGWKIKKENMINEDELLENEITNIFENEFGYQKKKTVESN